VPAQPCLLPALLTAGLLWLCYFPVAWGWWLGWVALVPLLCLVRTEARPRRVYLAAWAGGLAFFVPALQWMRVADLWMYAAWAALAVYISLYFPAAVWLLRRLDRGTRLPLAVTLPLVWTALEFLRAHLISGFPWYFLAHTQHDMLLLIQVSDLGGAYAVTVLVAAVNGLAFELLYRWRRFRGWFGLPAAVAPARERRLGLAVLGVLVLLGAYLGYGYWRMSQVDFSDGPRLALLQGNIKQRLRNEATDPEGDRTKASRQIIRHFDDLCVWATRLDPRPDLIIWPETSFPAEWWDVPPKMPADRVPARVQRLRRGMPVGVAKRYRTDVLLGLDTQIWNAEMRPERRYNSALLVDKKGQVRGRYDKIHRVPFGEFVPFHKELPFMDLFNAYGYDFSISAGESAARLPLGKHRFGVLICYEDTDPTLARQYARQTKDGPPADFLVNISNDGWFDGTSEHDEHLAICRFRAVEARRPVVRAVNMGISAVIDGNGRVLQPETLASREDVFLWAIPDARRAPDLPPSEWHRFKKVQGVLAARLPLDGRTSLYALWGDWLPWACWLGVAAGFAWTFLRRRALAVAPG
jgi:apolipoprotein N-acyltransferase